MILPFFKTPVCRIGTLNANYEPQKNKVCFANLLFDHEGCKVYRFLDMGNYVYFTNCTGDVTSIKRDSTEVHVINSVKFLPE